MENLWEDDLIQFARLLSELAAAGVPDEATMDELRKSMDLEREDIDTLFERAHHQWEASKEALMCYDNKRAADQRAPAPAPATRAETPSREPRYAVGKNQFNEMLHIDEKGKGSSPMVVFIQEGDVDGATEFAKNVVNKLNAHDDMREALESVLTRFSMYSTDPAIRKAAAILDGIKKQ